MSILLYLMAFALLGYSFYTLVKVNNIKPLKKEEKKEEKKKGDLRFDPVKVIFENLNRHNTYAIKDKDRERFLDIGRYPNITWWTEEYKYFNTTCLGREEAVDLLIKDIHEKQMGRQTYKIIEDEVE
jgi:hypothetical protein